MNRKDYAIYARNVYKHYKGGRPEVGLNGFDLTVQPGTIYGLLGPNGAGKTTALRIFSTLLQYDTGEVSVAGFDVKHQSQSVRKSIGLVGQYAAIDEILTGKQNLLLFAELLGLSRTQARQRSDELLAQFDLADVQNMPVNKYSGGMRRKLDLAASLIRSPDILFVDEPTTGLDPVARRDVWTAIEALAKNGTTILLTTQYLEEADQLADRIAMIKNGKVVAEGTPKELKKALGDNRVEVAFHTNNDMQLAQRLLSHSSQKNIVSDDVRYTIQVPAPDNIKTLVTVASQLAQGNIEVSDISLRQPTLDEVFINLTIDQKGEK